MHTLLLAAGMIVLSACRPPASGSQEEGAQLPSLLDGAVMRNAPVDAAPPRGGWVIYAFSPEAPESERNADAVERLARSLPPDWALLAVATETKGLAELLRRVRPTVPVLSQVPGASLAAYQITRTPRTYILDSNWKLIEVIDGAYEGAAAERLAARFKGPEKPLSAAGPGTAEEEEPVRLCRDPQQGAYSRGARAKALGRDYRCGERGVWIPSP